MRNLLFKMGTVLCGVALVVAAHSANVMCLGRYHQPKAPKNLELLKK